VPSHVAQIETGVRSPSIDVLERWVSLAGARLEIVTPEGKDAATGLNPEERRLIDTLRALQMGADPLDPRRAALLVLLAPVLRHMGQETIELLEETAWRFQRRASPIVRDKPAKSTLPGDKRPA
jgi:hypothetical protein